MAHLPRARPGETPGGSPCRDLIGISRWPGTSSPRSGDTRKRVKVDPSSSGKSRSKSWFCFCKWLFRRAKFRHEKTHQGHLGNYKWIEGREGKCLFAEESGRAVLKLKCDLVFKKWNYTRIFFPIIFGLNWFSSTKKGSIDSGAPGCF